MQESPLLSIIIVSFNTQKDLCNCIESIYACSNKSTTSFEIIVVDNDSSDDSVVIVAQKFPRVVLIQNSTNLGFGAANNIGVSKAKGKYLLLINPDTIADCDLVTETLNFFAQYPDHNAFGGMLVNLDNSEQRGGRRSFPTFLNAFFHFSRLSKVIKSRQAYDLSWLPVEIHEVECVSGACIGMPIKMYRSINGFDESFFLHFEDIDLCKRIWKKGYKLWFYPQVKLLHIKGSSSKNSQILKLKVNQWFLDSLGKYLWKWNKLSAMVFIPVITTLKLSAYLQGLQQSKIKKT